MRDVFPDTAPGSHFVFLETFGCQMNDNDSSRMLGFLRQINYLETSDPEGADLIIVNTCSIRDKAEQKVYSALGRFKALKSKRPDLILGVAGCVAEQEGDRLLKRVPHLDIVIGTHNVHKIGELIGGIRESGRRSAAVGFNSSIDADEYGAQVVEEGGVKAFVSIMRGCDNYCSYCIVPYTRGPEVSRPSGQIIAEVERLSSSGVKEVTLLGQNVNSYGSYGSADVSFPGLLRRVCAVTGIERVRFVTSHPKDISDELIGLFADEPKLCRHLHLPVQSGSDAVLKAMGRGYSRAEYLSIVEKLKAAYPDMSFTTDVIAGFPGETDEDFDRTMALIEAVRYDNIFSFMYSPRPGTRAASMAGHVGQDVKAARLDRLQRRQRAISLDRGLALVGSSFDVLVEGPSKSDPGELTGRTGCNRIINFPAPEGTAPGDVVSVAVTEAYQNSLKGACRERSRICSWR